MGIQRCSRVLFVATMVALVGCGGGGKSTDSTSVSGTSADTSSSSTSASSSSSGSTEQAFIVSTLATAGGSVSPSSATVAENGIASFTVTAETGYTIASTGGCAGSLSGTTYTTAPVTAACTVNAEFLLKSYSISTAAGEGGSITPASATIHYGATASFTLEPELGYAIDSASGCGGTLVDGVYTTGNVTSDCLISVQFTPQLFAISGAVTGLDGVLQLAYQDAMGSIIIDVTANGAFSVTDQAQFGQAYQVTVHGQPSGQECVVVNGSGIVADNVSDISVTCETSVPPARLSGTIAAQGATAVDSDLNDPLAPYADNSTPSVAQGLYHLATVHGFASAEPTAGAVDAERFATTADANDFYRVVLDAGQTVQLHVADHAGISNGSRFNGDLDLYLFDLDYNLMGVSDGAKEFEELAVPASQEYFIHIHAYAGVSKYALHLLPPPTSTTSSTSNTSSTAVSGVTSVPEFVPNQMIVKFHDQAGILSTAKPGLDPETAVAQATGRSARLGIDIAQVIPDVAMEEMQQRNPRAFDRVMTLRSVKKMRSRDDVVYAEPNYVRRALLEPNDPNYSYQWHYAAIGLPQAWDTTTGAGTGQDVIVAVVDTGVVLAHPDMSGQLLAGYDFITDPDRARDGNGIDADPDDPGDSDTLGHSSWHGTHVAGTVAAATNNGVGVAGVAWGAKIMPMRALGKGGGSTYDIIQAVRWAAGLANDSGTVPAQRADIINMSFGSPSGSAAEQDAFAEVRAAGVLLVAAAGNEASSEAFYPAAYPEVISVSATDYANQQAPYSNFGSTITVAAPGGDGSADLNRDRYPDGVLSTFADDSKGSIKPTYSFANGTSMAAPHVAGVLALMRAVHPQLSPDEVDSLLHSGSITDDLGSAGRDDVYGYGLINAVRAVQSAVSLADGGAPAPVAADVVVDPQRLDFGFRSMASIDVINQGGGTPAVVSVTASVMWLQVVAETIDSNGLGRYTVTVDRAALDGGVHGGNFVFEIDTGTSIVVPVTVHVDNVASGGELARLYVLLLDSISGEVIDEVVIEGGVNSASYAFEQVPAGEYLVVAGSDVDADDVLCTMGESCGRYSSIDQPQTLVVNGIDMTALDFSVGVLSGFTNVLSTDYRLSRE